MAENGKFYWLKLKRDFFKRHDVRIIKAMPNGRDYILLYLQLLLESIDHEGTLRFSETIPYSDEMLSVITETDINVVKEAKKLFVELNLMQILEDQTICMCEVEKLIGSTVDNENANRQRRYREKQKSKTLRNVTDTVTKNNESKRIEIEKETELEKEKEIHIKATLDDVKAYASERGRPDLAKPFFDYYSVADWKDKDGKPIINWKQKFIAWESRNPKAEQKQAAYGDADSFFEAAIRKTYDEDDEEIL